MIRCTVDWPRASRRAAGVRSFLGTEATHREPAAGLTVSRQPPTTEGKGAAFRELRPNDHSDRARDRRDVDGDRRIFADGSILIEGTAIAQIGRASEVHPPRPPDRAVDGRDLVVLPGFVDTHVHLSEHLNRGLLPDDVPVDRYLADWLVPLYSVITPEEERASALLACIEMIRTGTTTFCEAGTLFDVPAVAEAVERAGMRAVLGRWTWDLATGPGPLQQTTQAALAATEAVLRAVVGWGSGRVSAWPLLLGFGTCSDALMRGARALADRFGTGWGMMHFASHPSRRTSDHVPLSHLDGLGVLGPTCKLAHMVYVDGADIELLARRGVKVSHCPSAGLKHIKGLAAHGRFAEMLDRGVCVSLGGDSGNGSNHFDMLRLMYLTATIYKDSHLDVGVMPAERVLEMATIRGAEALGLQHEIGSIEVGKRADLVLFSRNTPEWRPLLNPVNNLVYAASGASVDTVIIDGQIVLDRGRLTTLDEGDLFDQVEALSRGQVARAGLRIANRWPVIT